MHLSIEHLESYQEMVETSIACNLQLWSNTHRGAGFLGFFNALQYAGCIPFKVESPLIERAIRNINISPALSLCRMCGVPCRECD